MSEPAAIVALALAFSFAVGAVGGFFGVVIAWVSFEAQLLRELRRLKAMPPEEVEYDLQCRARLAELKKSP